MLYRITLTDYLMKLMHLIQQIAPALPDSVPSKSQEMQLLKSLPFDELLNRLVSGIVQLAINVAIAVAVFYLGKFIISKIYGVVRKVLVGRHVDAGLSTFLLSMVRIVLYFILVVTVIGILGIETSSFLAIFASAGVAIGMALSGTLQNFAGGVLILLIKPYRVGDYIEAQGYAGTVKEIQIFHTLITTPDNKAIIIPNGGLSTGSINNFSHEKYRRVDWSLSISYGDDVEHARALILDILKAHPAIIDPSDGVPAEDTVTQQSPVDSEPGDTAGTEERDPWYRRMFGSHHKRMKRLRESRAEAVAKAMKPPYTAPTVVLDQLADSAIVLKIRAWVATPDYWDAYYQINESIYKAFADGSKGVSFPFPQMDVHLKSDITPLQS